MDGDSYSEGLVIQCSEISDFTAKSEPISECNKITKMLNGGLSKSTD